MCRNLMILFLIVAVVCTAVTSHAPIDDCDITPPPTTKKPPKCGVNEIWKECGTACQPTCWNLNPTCHKKCVKGCMCKDGLVRNKNGVCIRKCECDC